MACILRCHQAACLLDEARLAVQGAGQHKGVVSVAGVCSCVWRISAACSSAASARSSVISFFSYPPSFVKNLKPLRL